MFELQDESELTANLPHAEFPTTPATGDSTPANTSHSEIFLYLYAQLHAQSNKGNGTITAEEIFPELGKPQASGNFTQVAAAGRKLLELHNNHDAVEPYPLEINIKPGYDQSDRETWRVDKMHRPQIQDPQSGNITEDVTTIVYNPAITISGIPALAEEFTIGSQSALAGVIEKYQVKADEKTGLRVDPNEWADDCDNPRLIVELIAKTTRIAVESARIIQSLESE